MQTYFLAYYHQLAFCSGMPLRPFVSLIQLLVPSLAHHRVGFTFLLRAGLLAILLLLDDLFLVHEVVFPLYLHFGEKSLSLCIGLLLPASSDASARCYSQLII